MPLVMLCPDIDGCTALDRAVKWQRNQSLEIMINFLTNFDNFCVSKMMFDSLPQMLSSDSEPVYKFFDTAFYRPILIEDALIVYWPPDLDEFIFESPTSLITVDSL